MRSREVIKSPLTQLGVAIGGALFHTAIKDHRDNTHRSVETGPVLDATLDVMGGPFTDTVRWAAVHRVHHNTPDTNLLPAIEYTDLLQWLQANPEVAANYQLPEMVSGIDPAVPQMTSDDVVEVGLLAKQGIEGKYQPATHYTDDEIRRILYATEPRYFYESPRGSKKDDIPVVGDTPSLYDLRFILRDPHSPALHPQGMRGIARSNMPLYQDVVRFYENNPQFMPDDLDFTSREAWIQDHKRAVRLGFVATNIAARVIADRPSTTGEFGKSAAKGAVIAGLATAALIAGGNIVNSLGHGGNVKFASRRFLRDVGDGVVEVKPNGTYTTNNKLLSGPTLDEVGGQFEHHEDPSLIAYTYETGVKKFLSAPFGTAVEALAVRGIGMRVGQGFEGRRPDMPSDAVLKIEALRRAEYARTHGS